MCTCVHLYLYIYIEVGVSIKLEHSNVPHATGLTRSKMEKEKQISFGSHKY